MRCTRIITALTVPNEFHSSNAFGNASATNGDHRLIFAK